MWIRRPCFEGRECGRGPCPKSPTSGVQQRDPHWGTHPAPAPVRSPPGAQGAPHEEHRSGVPSVSPHCTFGEGGCWWQEQSPPATGENQAGQAPSLPKRPSDSGAQIQLVSLRNTEMFPKPPSPSPNAAGFTFLTSLFWGPLTHPPRTCSSLFFFFSIQSSLFFIVIALHYRFNLFPFLFIEHTLSWHKSHETK